MKRIIISLAAIVALTAPTMAAGYLPIGPKVYTPQPPIVTPQAPTVTPQAPTVTPGGWLSNGGSSEPHIGASPAENGVGWYNAKCKTIADVNDDCTVMTDNPGSSATAFPEVVTANPDLVTPNPDIITPVAPSCSRFGWSPSGGFGNYSC